MDSGTHHNFMDLLCLDIAGHEAIEWLLVRDLCLVALFAGHGEV